MLHRLKPLFIGFGIQGLVVLCILLGVRIWNLWDIPDFPDPVDLERIRGMSVAEEDNAAPVYRNAADLYQPATESEDKLILDLSQYDDWRESLPGLKDYLERNTDALEAWKLGTLREQFVPAPLSSRSSITDTDDFRFHELTTLSLLQSSQQQAQGEHEQAWNQILAVLRCSRQYGHQGGFMDRLYGNSSFANATERIAVWAADPGVTSKMLQQATADLEEIWSHTPRPSVTLQCEYAMADQGLDDFPLFSEEDEDRPSPLETVGTRCIFWIMGQPEAAHRLVNFYFHNQLTAVDLPRYDRPEQAGRAGVFNEPSALTFGGITWSVEEFEQVDHSWRGLSGMLTAFGPQFIESCDREHVRYEITRLILASQAYQRDHGQFPETLDKLVPEYLETVPLDPFDGRPMKYRYDDQEKVIYSVFRNETDDGGTVYSYGQVEHNNDLKDFGMQLTVRK